MKFNEYVQKLYPYCGDGCNPGEFVIRILSEISTEQNDDIFDKQNDYLKRIYNGTKNISKKSASYILTHLDIVNFETFIDNNTTEDARIKLSRDFEDTVGNCDDQRIPSELADLLNNILKEIINSSSKEQKQTKLNNSVDIEIELYNIVKKIASLTDKEIEGILKYEPYNIDKKILPENAVLKNDIKQNVVRYYSYIENLFKNLCQENAGIFDAIASQIKFASDNYISEGLTQSLVFDKMVEWLKQKVPTTNTLACRIIIAFFVQNCEVFHEITQ